VPQTRETGLQHPLWLVFQRRNIAHNVFVNAALCVLAGLVRVMPTEFVGTDAFQLWVCIQNILDHTGIGGFLTDLIRHYQPLLYTGRGFCPSRSLGLDFLIEYFCTWLVL